MTSTAINKNKVYQGSVYCPMCTHTVEAVIIQTPKQAFAKPGQQCSRCHSSLDAGYIFRQQRAA